jgi:predicted MFS family arabinose efflux permease
MSFDLSININLIKYVKILVFIDMFGVSLVVPLLSSYFRDAGVNSNSYGFLMSIYSIANLVSGLVLGVVSDYISKRDILLISFIGSGISYYMIGHSMNIHILFASRVLIGLVKQTMTISTATITDLTGKYFFIY